MVLGTNLLTCTDGDRFKELKKKQTQPDTDDDGYNDGIDEFPLDPNEYADFDKDGMVTLLILMMIMMDLQILRNHKMN